MPPKKNKKNKQKMSVTMAHSACESPKRALSSPEEEGGAKKTVKHDKNINSPDSILDYLDKFELDDCADPTACHCKKSFNEILHMIHDDMVQIRTQNYKFEQDLQEIKGMKEDMDFLNEKFESQRNEIEMLRNENKNMKIVIIECEKRLDNVDQYNRRQNVLFDSVKEIEGENTAELVAAQCQKLGLTINHSNIQVSHRLGKPREGKPRPIIARFASVGTAREIVLTVKGQFRRPEGEPTNEVSPPIKKDVVLAREHLTDKRAKILKVCLAMKKLKTINSCWVFNHEIYVKRRNCEKLEKGSKIEQLEDLKCFA